jgi:N-dimethylarginine dimethylaminohydrolase
MVFAANGATVAKNRVYGARFLHPERAAEGPAYLSWFRAAGYRTRDAEFVNEGEGDLLVAGDRLLAGTGFRTDPEAHAEAGATLQLPVVTLELVDPRYYHLDTALCVLGPDEIAYFPGAFSPTSQAVLRDLLRNPEKRAAMGSSARSLVETHYNWDRVARDTRTFTEQVAKL